MSNTPRSLAAVLVVAASVLAVSGQALAAPSPLRVSGVTSTDGSTGAYTYDTAQLPPGVLVRVGVTYPANGSTVVTLHVKGAVPNREYGAHAHVAVCGPTGAAAGGHFQRVPFPAGGSPTDPAYANPDNEVWLDVATDADGNGSAQSVVAWQPDSRRPMAVVIHAAHTSTEPGSAGTAGARLGCLTVPF
jgi:Cu-Zn family superoxide dismutase